MGIAIASGLDPSAGIITGIVGGLVVGAMSGCPLQVSGPAAGLSVIVLQLLGQYGLGTLGLIVVIAGMVQIAAGFLRLGRWFQAIAPAVVHGMLGGIGVLILASQFHVMLDDRPKGSGLQNLTSIPWALYDRVLTIDGDSSHHAAAIGVLTIVVMILWGKLPARLRAVVPAPLAAVVTGTAAATLLRFDIKHVDVPSQLWNAVTPPSLSGVTDPTVWVAALGLAFVASAETLLSAAAVDQMQSGPRTRYDKELVAQGVGNALCGALGALPMTGVIVRSSANVEAKAETRASTIMHGLWLLVFVTMLSSVLRLIPISTLAALLVYTGYKLAFNATEVKKLIRHSRAELAIYAITLVSIVCTDLLHGVIIGVACATLRLLVTFARLDAHLVEGEGRQLDLRLAGNACFITLPQLAETLEGVPEGTHLRVHLENLDYIDHACLELLSHFRTRHEALGGTVEVEWEELERRFRQKSPPKKALAS